MSEKEGNKEVNIQTFLRIRPSKKPSGFFKVDDINQSILHFDLPENYKSEKNDYINNSKLHHGFEFTGVIPMEATQEDVFKKVGISAVRNALDGYNSTIFAYGQTGSGKTFTLTGGPESYLVRGLIPRTISMIFKEARQQTDMQFKVYVSYLEIYNEQGFDLLDASHDTKSLDDLPKVVMLEDEHGNFHLKNLSMHVADSEEDALDLLFMGDTNRAIAETPMNMASSRSHCIFSLAIESRSNGSEKVRRSKLHLVDLAGSERVSKTNSSGSVLKEARYINSSLFYLEMVIVALYEKATKGRTHIPYRNSMMTSALRDSLGGNCRTVMIATINPESSHTEESISTCRFAQRVSLIKNKAIVNEDKDPQVVITRLKGEMLSLREEISYLKGEAGEGDILTPQELEDLKMQCRSYCDNLDPKSTINIGKLTLTKIKDVFAIMKNLVLESRANNGGSGTNTKAQSFGYDGLTAEQQDLDKQIRDLKSCLLQRDNEIAILVNMVKKGKTVDDVNSASRGSSRLSADADSGHVNPVARGGKKPQIEMNDEDGDESPRAWKQAQEKGVSSSTNHHTTAISSKSLQQQERERSQTRDELIIKRHLFGVPPPSDPKIFEDAAASFEWFRERCSLNKPMEENRELLKEKISSAKVLGERANQSRGTINYLKNSIEAIRRERAMARLNMMDAKGDQKEGDDESESPDEETHRRAIEQEKKVYKESFETLRVLKPEIEHVRKMLENCRMKMQSQFDEWFNNLHTRDMFASDPHASMSHQQSQANHSYEQSHNNQQPTASEGMANSQGPVVSRVKKLSQPLDNSYKNGGNSSSYDSQSRSHSSTNYASSSGPPSVALSKDEDNDVNEDIMAFYQAKEELLKRRKA